MYIIIWEYQVKPGKLVQFEEVYSPDGFWAELFKKNAGYIGTDLLHDETSPQRYLTIDRWESRTQYEAFRSKWETEYAELDEQSEDLTKNESLIGNWERFSLPGSKPTAVNLRKNY